MAVNQEKSKCLKCGECDFFFKVPCCTNRLNKTCLAVYHERCLDLEPSGSANGGYPQNPIDCTWFCGSCNRYRPNRVGSLYYMHNHLIQNLKQLNNTLEKGFSDLGNKLDRGMDKLANDMKLEHIRASLTLELQQLNSEMTHGFKTLNDAICNLKLN